MPSQPLEAAPPAQRNQTTAQTSGRLTVVDALRGIAALLVCWFHITNGYPGYPSGWLRRSGAEGHLGVSIFFVISGFVIPYALHAARYQPGDYGRFLVRRMIRIDAPCYATSLLIVTLTALFGASWGETRLKDITLLQTVLHLGYLNYIAGQEFFCGVFWSLAIEFQYYLMIGLLLPLLCAPDRWQRLFPYAFLGVMAVIADSRQLLFHYGFLFLLGILTFHRRSGSIAWRGYLLALPLLAAGVVYTRGPAEAIAATATALCIAAARTTWPALPPPLLWLGSLSYSLYLIHPPVGMRLVALGQRLHWPQALSAAVALGGSLCAAVLLHRLVERPAQHLASRIPYRRPAAPVG